MKEKLNISPEGKTRDEFINELISNLTVEEKAGQMTQVTLEILIHPRMTADEPVRLDPEKVRKAIVKHHVGSILNTAGAANSIENWHEIITLIQDISTKETLHGIPNLYGIDAIHGANFTLGATLFPQSIAMAASRNCELMEESAKITALEVRASGIAWNFNPVLDMGREPAWPRFWETFGEDVCVAEEMGKSYIRGLQGGDMSDKRRVASCLKHYVGYSMPRNGRDRTPAWIPERILRDTFLPPFAAGVEAGSPSVMINSAELNGIPLHSDHYLITEVLKGELGFKGFVVSDWEDIRRLYDRDRMAETPKAAVKAAVMAGLDMSMVPFDFTFAYYLSELVKEGDIPESRVDDAVRRILNVKYDLGLFNDPYPDKSLKAEFASSKSAEVNLEAARECITLLKNENDILPLSKDKKILVTGPAADKLSPMNGGWSITWQGDAEELYPKDKKTIFEAVKDMAGAENVMFVEGCGFDEEKNTEEAVKAAENSDVVIMCLGEPSYCETMGNIRDLNLYRPQIRFAKKIYETGKPVIMVLVEGRPRIVREIEPGAQGIIMAYLPGMEGGKAIADTIFGENNPSGKLPFSYPYSANGYTPYDHKPLEVHDVNTVDWQWPFGHGLSYTEFEYWGLELDKPEMKPDGEINVSVHVTNTGRRSGKTTVEMYITDMYGSVTRPEKELKGFQKIYLEPHESKEINFRITQSQLSFIGREKKRITEPGDFKVTIGKKSLKFRLLS